jgi:predicted transcriptional regulator
MNIPILDENGKRVLQFIKDRGVATGREITAATGLTPEALVPIIQKLISSDLVTADGNIFAPEQMFESYFNVRPSNLSLAEFVLKST